jgi:hypothetical protein
LAKKRVEMERLIRCFQDEMSKQDWDMEAVAKFAVSRGWPLPKPESPIKRLAKQFSQVAREKIKYDDVTGMPYRAYHAFKQKQGDTTLFLWFDTDEDAPRKKMHKSLIMLREQMVGDGLQISYDQDHWNRTHPNEKPIQIPLDFTDDVLERKSLKKELKKAS